MCKHHSREVFERANSTLRQCLHKCKQHAQTVFAQWNVGHIYFNSGSSLYIYGLYFNRKGGKCESRSSPAFGRSCMIFLFAARLAQLFLHQISAFAMAAADNGAPAAARQALCASCTSFMMVNRGSHQCLKVAMDLNSQGDEFKLLTPNRKRTTHRPFSNALRAGDAPAMA